jgi:hypothetical protein
MGLTPNQAFLPREFPLSNPVQRGWGMRSTADQWLCRTLYPHRQGRVFAVALKRKLYTTIDELQTDFEIWLIHYNTGCPHLGYRNRGAVRPGLLNVLTKLFTKKVNCTDKERI